MPKNMHFYNKSGKLLNNRNFVRITDIMLNRHFQKVGTSIKSITYKCTQQTACIMHNYLCSNSPLCWYMQGINRADFRPCFWGCPQLLGCNYRHFGD